MIIRDAAGNELCDTHGPVDLSEFDLRRASFAGISVEAEDLSDGNFAGADFSGAHLYWTYLFRSHLAGANFRKARLARVVLDLADLRAADLTGAYLSYDNLGGACSLEGTNLTCAILVNVDLRGSAYDAKTIFPAGFDPDRHGMVSCSEQKQAQQELWLDRMKQNPL